MELIQYKVVSDAAGLVVALAHRAQTFPASCVTEAQNLSYLRSSLSRFQQLGLGVLKELKKEQDAELMTWSISYIGLR